MKRMTISAKQWLIPPLAVIRATVLAALPLGAGVPQGYYAFALPETSGK
jgi:hypothetical protein